MKVLIITYYWPPAGGSGVQRWLKFVKYLSQFGVEPIIYVPENAAYAITDETLAKEIPENATIVRHPIVEPNTIFSFFSKKSKQESAGFLNPNPSFLGKVLQYIRANYFIPDARKFWVKPSVKFLHKYLSNHSVDAIITTGPPHSVHLIGLALKQKTNLPWIADFRDPWTEIDYFHQLPLSKKSKKKHLDLEQKVVSTANKVIVVGKTMKEKFATYSNTVEVITNGFDIENLENKSPTKLDSKFTITHIGLMNSDRNPTAFLQAVSELLDENKDFAKDLSIKLIGKVSDEVVKSFQKYVPNNTEFINYLPHQTIKQYQASSQVLLLVINKVPSAKGIVTGKIFEYLQAKRPIISIGPKDGDAAEIIVKANAGETFSFIDVEDLKLHLLSLYNQYKNGTLVVDSNRIDQYHRKELTKDLVTIIKEVIS